MRKKISFMKNLSYFWFENQLRTWSTAFCPTPTEGDGNLCNSQMVEMKVQVPKYYTNHYTGRIKPELEQSLFPSTHGCMSKGKKKGRGQMKENSSSVELASSHTQQVNNALAPEVIHSISFTLLLYLLQSDLWRYRHWSLECCV